MLILSLLIIFAQINSIEVSIPNLKDPEFENFINNYAVLRNYTISGNYPVSGGLVNHQLLSTCKIFILHTYSKRI